MEEKILMAERSFSQSLTHKYYLDGVKLTFIAFAINCGKSVLLCKPPNKLEPGPNA
jgi:hypothetical protein